MRNVIKIFNGSIAVPTVRGSLALLFLLLSLALPAFLPGESGQKLIRHAGYYFTLAAFVGAVCYFARSGCWNRLRNAKRGVLLGCISSVFVASWAALIHYEPGFKIAMDEYILASTAKSMHEYREVYAVSRITPDGNSFRPSEGFVDKRPWGYAMLVSVLHDLTGFRLENSFYLNAALLFALLLASFALGYAMFGAWAGALCVLLWANLPLLGLSASGGGMELLSLTLLVCLLLAGCEYLQRPGQSLEGLLSTTAVLLAYTRYECLLFIIPVVVVILIGWRRERRCFLSVGTLLASLLLAPLGLHLMYYLGNSASWELTRAAGQAFSIGHLVENFGHALNFFFSYDDSLANSIVLSFVGLLGVVALPFVVRNHLPSIRREPAQQVVLWFLPFVGLQMLLVLGFHASRLDSPFVSRYALMFHLLLILASLFLVSHAAEKWLSAWRWAAIGAFVGLAALTMPQNAKSTFVGRNFAIREQEWLEACSRESFNPHALVIDRFTIPWSLRQWVSLTPQLALAHADMITNEVRYGRYPSIYYIERLAYAGGGEFRPLTAFSAELHSLYGMKLMAEKSFRPFTLTRVYLIEGYHGNQNESVEKNL